MIIKLIYLIVPKKDRCSLDFSLCYAYAFASTYQWSHGKNVVDVTPISCIYYVSYKGWMNYFII